MTELPILRAEGLRLAYGDVTAVWNANLTATEGEIAVLLGRNGASKTTMLAGIAGLIPTNAGSVRLLGQDITKLAPWSRARAGLGLVLEDKRVFRDLTVQENLTAAVPRGRDRAVHRIDALYNDFPLLRDVRRKTAGSLSGGQQQLLTIDRAVAAEPRVLMVDEPSSGLAPQTFDHILDVLCQLRDRGLAIVLVEQQVDQVLDRNIANRVVVLDRGRVVLASEASAVHADQLAKAVLNV